ncbi:hypothetical protein [Akkermansia glycaniphila]|uniref:Uncharacterized protein n=1 Tax=Akkermansia glycaniphila TaxID=1679444 RepID=A0A1C7P9B4_9BACT|nr:hypothetical protein [Akkermansia glycaniphila]OCA02163.1 hypothetical protein AC781_11420 [Akkermansia glycaniphila]SEH99619.1 Hypothetical protein PYTT_2413 [Akkermansia glycaniphila]
MSETNNTPEPTHDCAETIGIYLRDVHTRAEMEYDKNDGLLGYGIHKHAWTAVAKAAPGIIATHAGDDVREWLARQASTSSGWRKWLFGIACASVGAVVLWGASFFTSCAPVTPEQVQQIDAAHAIMHRVTGTGCTLCRSVTSKFK